MYVFKSRSKGEQEAFQLRIEYEVGGRVQRQVEGDKEESYRIRREVPTDLVPPVVTFEPV